MVRVACGATIFVFAVASQEPGCTGAGGNPYEVECCPGLREVLNVVDGHWDYACTDPNDPSDPRSAWPPLPPAGQEYAQCSGHRVRHPYDDVVTECNSGFICFTPTLNSGTILPIGYCVDPKKQVQFAKGVGCTNGRGCCNSCPDGYEPILDVKVCAAATQVWLPYQYAGCEYDDHPVHPPQKWEDIVGETNYESMAPGCAAFEGQHQAGSCSLRVNHNNNHTWYPGCGDGYDKSVICQLSNAGGSDFTV